MQNKKLLRAMAIIVTVALATGLFVLREHNLRGQRYTGEIEETYRTRDWLRGVIRSPTEAEYRYYRHYWRIREDSGRVRNVRLHYLLWKEGSPGTPVRKVAGERHPRIDTPEAERLRQIQDQMIDDVVDGVRRRIIGDE